MIVVRTGRTEQARNQRALKTYLNYPGQFVLYPVHHAATSAVDRHNRKSHFVRQSFAPGHELSDNNLTVPVGNLCFRCLRRLRSSGADRCTTVHTIQQRVKESWEL